MATIKPAEGVKIAADNTDPDQYSLEMSKKLLNFVNGPNKFDIPVQVIRIGDFMLYTFPGKIFYQFGTMVKESASTEKYIVATMCNASIGYVPTCDMHYPTIYESLLGSCTLEKEGGYIMIDELIKMGQRMI